MPLPNEEWMGEAQYQFVEEMPDEPPGALDVIGILVGQKDGKVKITDRQLVTMRRDFIVVVYRCIDTHEYTIQLVPNVN